jgi:hypothetical protein
MWNFHGDGISDYSLVSYAISEEYAVSIFGVVGGRMFL